MTIRSEIRESATRRESSRRPTSAFTLLEMLVVLGIIGVLVGLLLPAINGAREAGRRVQCANNLMQLSLALHHYEADHKVLPPGVVDSTSPIVTAPAGYHYSWIVQILPDLDQRDLFRMVNFRNGAYDPANDTLRSTSLGILHCPDDAAGSRASSGVTLTSYAGCHHDVEAPIDKDNHGVLFLNSHVTFQDISDGLSYTLFIGEVPKAHPLGWFSGTRATLRNTGHPINRQHVAAGALANSGFLGAGGEPSSEDVEEAINTGALRVSPLFVGGFGSAHNRDGATFAFGDGSVRFVQANIDPVVYQHLGHRSDGEAIDGESY